MSHLRTTSSRRRGLHASTINSSRLRMDTHSGPRGNSRGRSPKHKEIDKVMKKARSESGPQSNYWTKKLLEAEEKDPNRWRHSGFKELYRNELGGSNGGSRSKSRSRSRNRSKKAYSPPPLPRLPRTRSRSRDRSRSNHIRGRTGRDRSRSPRGRSRSPRGRSRSARDRSRSARDRSRSARDRSRSARDRSRSVRDHSRSDRVRPRENRDLSRSRGRPSTPATRPSRHGAPRSPPPERKTAASRGSNRRRERSSSKNRLPPSPPTPAQSSSSSTASSVESCSNESCSVCSPRRGSEAPIRHHHSPHHTRSRSFSVPRSSAVERARSPPRPPEPAPPKRKKVAGSSSRRIANQGSPQPTKAGRSARSEGVGKRSSGRSLAARAPEGNGPVHETNRTVNDTGRTMREGSRSRGPSGGIPEEPAEGTERREGRRRRLRSPGSSRRGGARDPVSVSSDSESDSDSVSQSSDDDTPPRLTLSERFGRMAQWSVDRREFDSVRMRITKDSHSSGKKVVIEDGASLSPPPSSIDGYMRGSFPDGFSRPGTAYGPSVGVLHRSPVPDYPHSAYRLGLGRGDESPNGVQAVSSTGVSAVIPEGTIADWDDIHVRYRYYRDRGYFWDMGIEEYTKWEEWCAKYQEWLEMERYYEQVAQHREWAAAAAAAAAASSGRPRHGGSYGRRNRGRSHDERGSGEGASEGRRGKGSGGAWSGETGGGRKRRR